VIILTVLFLAKGLSVLNFVKYSDLIAVILLKRRWNWLY